jgi:hypothetical protein
MCPMSPRLLRPRTTLHPEAAAWRNAVIANGGTVSGSTLTAVSKFCFAIDGAGIRDRFYRLNLFCGTGLSAALVPLYRGQSRTGTQFGNTTDTNNGPFVSGDYNETGASGGLLGNGTSKYLDTGFAPNTLSLSNTHLSAYAVAANSTVGFPAAVGSFSGSGSSELALYFHQSTLASAAYFATDNGNGFVLSGANNPTGHLIGTATAATERRFFLNGSQSGSTNTTSSTVALDSRVLWVFRRNNASASQGWSNARLGSYSIGAGLSVSQASAFYTAMQAFQTALSRNV